MLKKQSRLSRLAFNGVFRAPKRSHSPHFQLLYVPEETLTASVVVSKKIAKTAVSRNTLRRRVYNLLRNASKEQSLRGGYIVIAKQGASDIPFRELKAEIIDLIGKNRSNTVQ